MIIASTLSPVSAIHFLLSSAPKVYKSLAGLSTVTKIGFRSVLEKKGVTKMNHSKAVYILSDNGGRRLVIDRRRFSYDVHIPERRCGEERRSGVNRRSGIERRSGKERAVAIEMKSGKDRRSGIDRRNGIELKVAFARLHHRR